MYMANTRSCAFQGIFRFRGGAYLFLLFIFLSPSSSGARTVPYLHEMKAIHAAAQDQGIAGPFSEAPVSDGSTIVLTTPAAADHRVVIASVYCKAYRIDNPVSILLRDLVTSANGGQSADAATDGPSILSLRIISGSTVLRCMGKNDFETICQNRVRITAEVSSTRSDGTIAKIPVTSQTEREGRVGGFCGNIARYTGIVTREAAIDLISQARKALRE